ncbi:hypothetical protein SDC9_05963 [bioreactor metagenome]|uniref:Uncharacterized protein n=1 Tax=bioreactor metagenome TaxID=1076179 RepID=A0A644T2F9_9ZZZZ|nr:hypothetical protein [Negativicutes bacterium]
MPREKYGVQPIILTFSDGDPILAGAYEAAYKAGDEEGMKTAIKRYKFQIKKYLNALIASIDRHAKSSLAKRWKDIKIVFAASYNNGDDSRDLAWLKFCGDEKGIERAKVAPERLHIHVLITGTCAFTVKEYIDNYWRYIDTDNKISRHGLVEKDYDALKGNLDTEMGLNNYLDYMKNQAFTVRNWCQNKPA